MNENLFQIIANKLYKLPEKGTHEIGNKLH